MHRQQRAAFTLVELLVVIAVMSVIAAILFPVFARVREKARQATCLSSEKQIGAAVLMYMQDYDEAFPFVLNFSGNLHGAGNFGDDSKYPLVRGVTGQEPQFQLVNVVASYVKNQSIWYCPSIGPDFAWEAAIQVGVWQKGMTMRDQGTSYYYAYLALSWPQTGQGIFMGGKPSAILWEPSRWPMLSEEPTGWLFTGNVGDPPASVVPHSGGMNVAYGDGHAKFVRMETADGATSIIHHIGDGVIPGQ